MRARIFIDADLHHAWRTTQTVALSEAQAHYLRDVLRLKKEAELIVFDGTKGEFRATIEMLSSKQARVRLTEFLPVDRELAVDVHIVQALIKGDRLDYMLQKSVELGARSIALFASARSVVRLTEARLASRLQRWQRIVQEAAEQSGRTRMPLLQWLDKPSLLRPKGLGLLLDAQAEMGWGKQQAAIRDARALTLLIGPEGGWTQEERNAFVKQGFLPLRFGRRTLRAETAAPALLAAIAAVHPMGAAAEP